MLFQGKDFLIEEVREAYEEAMTLFYSFGIEPLSFEDWVQYNNDYCKDEEKALDKWVRKPDSKKKRGR